MKKFAELSAKELFSIYHLRVEVFVVEQKCAYQEVDEKDLVSYHMMFQDAAGDLCAYARIIPEKEQVRLGRVVVAAKYRAQGLGKHLLEQSLNAIECRYPEKTQVLQAQAHLVPFYEHFGFQSVGEIYLEDGIPHQDMQREEHKLPENL